jgi:hypothetical protein
MRPTLEKVFGSIVSYMKEKIVESMIVAAAQMESVG